MGFIVAIDGPAGAGKGTIAKRLGNRLNLSTLDTGAIFRAISLYMLRAEIGLKDIEEIKKALPKIEVKFKYTTEGERTLLNGEDVSIEIRQDHVNNVASPFSSIKEIRYKVMEIERELAIGKDIIMEGRDIGTTVFPNADVKIYLDASLDERAKRRYEENIARGIKTTLAEVKEKIISRDKNDMEKEFGALKIADDAIVIDSTNMSIEEVEDAVANIIIQKRKGE